MKSPASEFQTAVAADTMAPTWLIEIQASTVLRYTFWPRTLTFNSQTWTTNAGDINVVESNAEGRSPQTLLTIQNIDRVIGAWFDAADRRGTVVVLYVVMTDNLDDPTAALDTTFEIDSYAVKDRDVEITLAASDILGGVRVPGRQTTTWFCPWVYKSTECGSTSTLATCDYTYWGGNGCKKHFPADEPRHFGGWIGRPQKGFAMWGGL